MMELLLDLRDAPSFVVKIVTKILAPFEQA
jgi:hypothetical protein